MNICYAKLSLWGAGNGFKEAMDDGSDHLSTA